MASYRPITEEIAAPTTSGGAVTVSDADIVRVVNTTTSPHLVTVLDSNDNTIGSMTLTGGEKVFLKKREGDKLFAANAGVRFTRITYPVM
jgi:outer membrane protein assembly factor BamB